MNTINDIWIVDDNEVNNFICESLINVALPHVQVRSFTDAQDAIDALVADKSQVQRIVLLDVNMPIMNGWQFLDTYVDVAQQIQSLNVIYMLTSSIAKTDLEMADNYPFLSGFLSKPLTKELIVQMYEEQTNNSK